MARLLEIENAEVYCGDTRVFHGLNLTLVPGENTAILGPNGSGKTTLLKLLTRDLHHVQRAGSSVRILGEERWDVFELRRQLGIVSQDLQTLFRRRVTGLDVVTSGFFSSIGVQQHQVPSVEQIERARSWLGRLGVSHLERRYFSEMSVGEQRRCLIARALINEPHTLVLDEPTSGLDIKASFDLLSELRQLMQEGRTLVLVTHHLHEIPPEITRVVLLKRGEILADGPKEDVLQSALLSDLFELPVEVIERAGHYEVIPVVKKGS